MFPVQGSATALVAQTRHREPVPWRTTRSKFRHFFHLFDACYNLAYQLGQQGEAGEGLGRAGCERCGQSSWTKQSLYPRVRKIPGRIGKRTCDHDA